MNVSRLSRCADAHGGDGVAVVAVLDGDELAAAGVGHGDLQRAFDRFGAAGGAVGDRELAGRDAGEHFGELDPGAVEVVGMNVIGAIELPRRRADLGVPPAQVADAPAHHEVDVFAAAGVGEIAVGGVADDDVLGFALAAEVLFVELAEVHAGLLSHAGEDSAQRGGKTKRRIRF